MVHPLGERHHSAMFLDSAKHALLISLRCRVIGCMQLVQKAGQPARLLAARQPVQKLKHTKHQRCWCDVMCCDISYCSLPLPPT